MRWTVWLTGGVLLAAAACSDDGVTGLATAPALGDSLDLHVVPAARHITVMSRNMYIGAPVEPILAETDPNLVPVRVAEAWATLLATDFPTRAKLLAREIARYRPHLVGLQEVSLLRTQFPSDVVLGNPVPNATDVAFDFLAILLDELAAHGAGYTAVVTVQNTDVEVPRFDGIVNGVPQFTDVRVTDFDAILARADVSTANPAAANFAAMLPAPAGIQVLRGWTAVDADVRGVTYRFVNTHLESDAEIIRFLQAQELVGLLNDETKPLLLVGDFNSGPGRPLAEGGQATYDFIVGNGYADVWTERVGRRRNGFTCCHAGDLSNRWPTFSQRIDLAFARNIDGLPDARGLPIVMAAVVGDELRVRRRFGVWPSDHGGVVARLVLRGGLVAD